MPQSAQHTSTTHGTRIRHEIAPHLLSLTQPPPTLHPSIINHPPHTPPIPSSSNNHQRIHTQSSSPSSLTHNASQNPSLQAPQGHQQFPPTFFEALPPELTIELILALHSFGDLNALISASPHALRIFNTYTTTILNRLSRNIIGPEAWHDNVVVLICQRHHCPVAEPVRLIRDLMNKFTFTRGDIPHMASNERVYRTCAAQFAAAASTAPSFLDAPFAFRTRPPGAGAGAGAGTGALPMHISLRNTPGCPRNGVLPRRMFYRVWVYCVATKFENVGFPVEYLSCAQRIELRLVQYLMQPKEVKRVINYELMVGFKGRRPARLKKVLAGAKPRAERAWEKVLGLPREAVEGWEEFKALGKRGLLTIIEGL